MSHQKLNHDKYRRKVCAPCGKKIVFGIKKKEYLVLNSRYFSLIKEFVNTNYSMVDKNSQLVYVRLVTLHCMITKKIYLKGVTYQTHTTLTIT